VRSNLGQYKRPHEVGEIVGRRMKMKTYGTGGVRYDGGL
jgi:hypothetical protein